MSSRNKLLSRPEVVTGFSDSFHHSLSRNKAHLTEKFAVIHRNPLIVAFAFIIH